MSYQYYINDENNSFTTKSLYLENYCTHFKKEEGWDAECMNTSNCGRDVKIDIFSVSVLTKRYVVEVPPLNIAQAHLSGRRLTKLCHGTTDC